MLQIFFKAFGNAFRSLNQLLHHGETFLKYDPNGNLIEKKTTAGVTRYLYDALDRLQSVETASQKASYIYDAFHRRTRKIIQTASETKEERYLYQGEKECAATDETGSIVQLRIMGLGCKGDIGASVLLEIEGNSYVPLHDYRGNPILLLDLQGNTVEDYSYTAFGEEGSSDKLNPWRFSSKRVDPETGFSYFGSRYYDPCLCRWITPDPLWFVDGPNLYAYVKNRSTLFIDPEGLSFSSIIKDTVNAVLELVLNVNVALDYGEDSNYKPMTQMGSKNCLDKRSHIIHPKEGAQYGPVMLCWVNGICNSTEDTTDSMEHLENMDFKIPVFGVYNRTRGPLFDFVEAILNLLHINTMPVDLLHKQWDDYFDTCEANNITPTCIQTCHSQGELF